jgi:hypothetical protein
MSELIFFGSSMKYAYHMFALCRIQQYLASAGVMSVKSTAVDKTKVLREIGG